jgi:DNA-binding IclR family transcriptional regulator
MPAEKGANQSVEKAIGVLETFTGGEPLRVGDVARAAGISQSNASRLLSTLESGGLVERDPLTSLYSLGTKLMTLAGVAVNQNRVHRAGREIAQDLARQTALGVNIALVKDAELVYVCNFEGPLTPKAHTLLGQRVPVHATSIGKSTLIGTTRATREEALPQLGRFTEGTITSHDLLDEEVERIALRGYATEVEEFVLGRASVAAPLRDQSGRIIAAISISGPVTALDLASRETELGRLVLETADRISSALGYQGPAG